MKEIAHIYTDFPTKFGIPRQSGIVEGLSGKIVFKPEYRNMDAFSGLEEFSYIWLIWQFSENVREKWSATVRPPRLGDNQHRGVFATRSPFRPNPIGLSSVKLEKIVFEEESGPVIYVSGVDMVNGTPIYDIKPYIPYADSHPDAAEGFTKDTKEYSLEVDITNDLQNKIPKEKQDALLQVLSQDPRPAYQKKDPKRIYGFPFAGFEVKFQVIEGKLIVRDIELEGK